MMTNYYNYNHFMALWTTWVGRYQKVHFAVFWIFWCKMKMPAAALAIQMDCQPIQTNWYPHFCYPHLLTMTKMSIKANSVFRYFKHAVSKDQVWAISPMCRISTGLGQPLLFLPAMDFDELHQTDCSMHMEPHSEGMVAQC